MEQDIGDFLEDGYLKQQQVTFIRYLINHLLTQIRSDAVTLVDSFNHFDKFLNSNLGSFDGNV